MNHAFTEPLVVATPGGAGGGGAALTEFGAEVLERYRRIDAGADAQAAADLTALARRARADPTPKFELSACRTAAPLVQMRAMSS